MSTRRPPRPLDPKAVQAANEALWKAHPELGGRQLTMESGDTKYRKGWMDAYLAATGKPAAPQPPAPAPPDKPVVPCPTKPPPDPSPCSDNHACRNQGLDKRENRDEFIQDMRELKEKVRNKELSPDQLRTELLKAVNKQLAKDGVPDVKLDDSSYIFGIGNKFERKLLGQYYYKTHRVTINKAIVAPDPASPDFDQTFNDLAGSVYHEARHAEQWQRAAEHMVNDGSSQEDLTDLGYTPKVAEAAGSRAPTADKAELTCGKSIYNSIFGSGSAHRKKVLGEDAEKAKENQEKTQKRFNQANDRLAKAKKAQQEATAEEEELTGKYQDAERSGGVGLLLQVRLGRAMEVREEADRELQEATKEQKEAAAKFSQAQAESYRNWKDYESLPEESDAHCQSNIIGRVLKAGAGT